jgi:hypothetical protein
MLVHKISRGCGISRTSFIRILHRHKFYRTTSHFINSNMEITLTIVWNSVSLRFISYRIIISLYKSFIYWWSFLHKTWASQFEEHALLLCENSSLASPSWPSTAMEGEHLVGHNWWSCYWTALYWGIVIRTQIRTFSLSETLPLLLEDLPLQTRPSVHMVPTWRLPEHYALEARQIVNGHVPDRWMGRVGPVRWQAGSPDLTHLNLFLWDWINDKVYQEPPRGEGMSDAL